MAVTPSLLNVCGIDRPVAGLQGKFSLRAATALTLLGESTPTSPSTPTSGMAAADVNAMIDRITVVGDPQQPMPCTTVTVSTADGRRREASYNSACAATTSTRSGTHSSSSSTPSSIHAWRGGRGNADRLRQPDR